MDEVRQVGRPAVDPEPDVLRVQVASACAAREAASFPVDRTQPLAQAVADLSGRAAEVEAAQVRRGEPAQANDAATARQGLQGGRQAGRWEQLAVVLPRPAGERVDLRCELPAAAPGDVRPSALLVAQRVLGQGDKRVGVGRRGRAVAVSRRCCRRLRTAAGGQDGCRPCPGSSLPGSAAPSARKAAATRSAACYTFRRVVPVGQPGPGGPDPVRRARSRRPAPAPPWWRPARGVAPRPSPRPFDRQPVRLAHMLPRCRHCPLLRSAAALGHKRIRRTWSR